MIFVDHAAYGRPWTGPEFFSESQWGHCEGLVAPGPEDHCVASNSLAAVTYWCQGKTKCEVQMSLIEDVGKHREFFVARIREIGEVYLIPYLA